MCLIGFQLNPAFAFSRFIFFFFFSRSYLTLRDKIYCYEQCIYGLFTVHILFIHLKLLKMGLTILFTHLKIILL